MTMVLRTTPSPLRVRLLCRCLSQLEHWGRLNVAAAAKDNHLWWRNRPTIAAAVSSSSAVSSWNVNSMATILGGGECGCRRLLYSTRGGGGSQVDSSSSSSSKDETKHGDNSAIIHENPTPTLDEPDVMAILRELAKRLDEPKPLRSTSSLLSPSNLGKTIRGNQTIQSGGDHKVVHVTSDVHDGKPHDNSTRSSSSSTGGSLSSSSLHDLATHLCQTYRTLPHLPRWAHDGDVVPRSARQSVIEFLATECTTHRLQIIAAMDQYQKQVEDVTNTIASSTKGTTTTTTTTTSIRSSPLLQSQERLRKACTDRYEMILSYLLQQNAQLGMKFVLTLREDLWQLIQWKESQQQQQLHSQDHQTTSIPLTIRLKRLDSYIRQLLITWFSPGMIDIRRITYEHTSAAVIEEIATKEAVHPMKSLEDLKLRLGCNRRVFCLFHPLLPNVPLVFVHVSLSTEMPSSMDRVLKDNGGGNSGRNNDEFGEQHWRVATFYSISNAQAGLAGVGLGEYLIKNAVLLLQAEFPQLETFCTLSPIPRFRRWMTERVALSQGSLTGSPLLSEQDASIVAQVLHCAPSDAAQRLLAELEQGPAERDHSIHDLLRPILLRLAARYICLEKHHGKPLDAVTRFHVSNGAQVYRLNYLADVSRKGWHNSFGVMINYRYHLDSIAQQRLQYEHDYRIPVCDNVMELLK